MSKTVIKTRRWTRREYDRLIDLGILHEDEPVELVAGRLIVAEPQNDPHARAIELVADTLRAAFGPGWRIRVQLPLALGTDSEPEPDVTVIRGTARDAKPGHPSTAALVVEVADSSVRLDRGLKARVYARARIADYWVVNLVDRTVEVHREPTTERRRPARYQIVRVARPGDRLVPLAAPSAVVPVADLLP